MKKKSLGGHLKSSDHSIMFDWFQNVGYIANVNECKKLVPEINTFEIWAKKILNIQIMVQKHLILVLWLHLPSVS